MRESGKGQALAAADAVGEPDAGKRQELNELFALNRKLLKAYLLKESLDRLWTYRYEGAMLNYLQAVDRSASWQRLEPFQKLARCCWTIWTAS